MEDLFQLALAVFFAAALLVTGQLFMEYSSSGPLDELPLPSPFASN